MGEGKKIGAIIAIIILVLGGCALVFLGMWGLVKRQEQKKGCLLADAQIVSVRTRSMRKSTGMKSHSSAISYVPIYEYVVDGMAYRVSLGYGIGRSPKVGTKGKVYYKPEHPDQSFVKGSVNTSAIWLMLGIVAVLAAGATYVMNFRMYDAKLKEGMLNLLMGLIWISLGFGLFYLVRLYVNFWISGLLLAFGGIGIYLLVAGIRILVTGLIAFGRD